MSKQNRLKAPQAFQLANAVAARIAEFAEKGLNQEAACKELAEGLGFAVGRSSLDTALEATGLIWPRSKPKTRRKAEFSSRDLLEALVRDHIRICAELGVQESATLRRYYDYREEMRKRNRQEKMTLPLVNGTPVIIGTQSGTKPA